MFSGDTVVIDLEVDGASGWPPGSSAVWVAARFGTTEEILRKPAQLVDPDIARVTIDPEDTAALDADEVAVHLVHEFQIVDPLGAVQTVGRGALIIRRDFA
jgi:hypothetical protein